MRSVKTKGVSGYENRIVFSDMAVTAVPRMFSCEIKMFLSY